MSNDCLELDLTEDDIQGITNACVLDDVGAWLEAFGRIKVKDRSKGENGLCYLRDVGLGYLQREICEAITWCLKNRKPIRLLIYKKRQTGASTGSIGVLYWFLRRFCMDALIIGAKSAQTKNLWEIYKTYAENDHFTWGVEEALLKTGSTLSNKSRVVHESLEGKDPGRSGTWTVVIATEVARWAEEGVKNASETLTGISNGVPYEPLTCVIWETTVRGGSGAFYEKWQGARTLEEFQAGDEGNGFIKIFEPWFHGFDSRLPVSARERANILAGRGALDAQEAAREQMMMRKYGLTPEHIKYWRHALDNCQGDPDERDRDYPTTPEDGFRASVPGRFNQRCLSKIEIEMESALRHNWHISMVQPDARRDEYYAERRDPSGDSPPQFIVSEEPQEGCRYIMAIDTMRGLEDKERRNKDKRDTHGLVVIRDGYFEPVTKTWSRPKVVASLLPNTRWSITDLGIAAYRLAEHFGKCLIVPERNFDAGLIKILKDLGAHVWEEEKPATEKDAGEKTGKYGFQTTTQSRAWILEELARAIRFYNKDAQGIEIPMKHIVDELQHFVTIDGKDQAMRGHFDDHVMALAIGYSLKGAGTVFRRRYDRHTPQDIRLLTKRRAGATSGTHSA